MAVTEDDMQVLNLALKRTKAALQKAMMVRTQTIVDLGGIEALPASDRSRWENTPEASKYMLTSLIPTKVVEQLIST